MIEYTILPLVVIWVLMFLIFRTTAFFQICSRFRKPESHGSRQVDAFSHVLVSFDGRLSLFPYFVLRIVEDGFTISLIFPLNIFLFFPIAFVPYRSVTSIEAVAGGRTGVSLDSTQIHFSGDSGIRLLESYEHWRESGASPQG